MLHLNTWLASVKQTFNPRVESRRAKVLRWSGIERMEVRQLLSAFPVGTSFPVNSTKAGNQSQPIVASDADGDFVVTWESDGQDGSDFGVYAQRYTAAGIALGNEFRVNTYTALHQSNPSVAMDPDGDFVIAWQSYGQEGVLGFGIYAQRYDATGAPVGNEFHVNTYISSQQTLPSVAMDSDGDFVIAWQSLGQLGPGFGARVYARRYSALGVPQGGEFPVDVDQPSAQVDPAVAMNGAGDFVVTWSSADSSDAGVYAKGYDADGSAVMDTFPVNTDQLNSQNRPSIAADVDGDFVIVWQSAAQGNVGYDIYAQRFSGAAKAAAGAQFKVNSGVGDSPFVSMDASGDFVVAWKGSASGIHAKQYNASGSVLKEEFAVNSNINLSSPSVAMDSDGDFVVTLQGIGVEVPTATYQNSSGILAQRFDESTSTAGPTVTAIFDGNRQIFQGGRLATNVDALTVLFSEDLNVVGGTLGGNSVLNPANWRLMQNGDNVSSLISDVAFGLNSLTNKFEATISFSETLPAGTYKLTALQAIQDLAGNSIDGNLDGIPGGDYVHSFAIEDLKPAGPEFRVNKLFATGDQLASSVAMDADGDSVVVWQSYGQDGSGWGIYAQRYDASGIPQGNEFLVNSDAPSGNQKTPSVAMDPDGDFVVAWESGDGDGYGIIAKKFNAAGIVTSGPFLINNTVQAGQQRLPSVAIDAAGDFVISWSSLDQDGSGYGVYARKFDANFNQLVAPFRLNEAYVTGDQRNTSVATNASGNFVVTWSSQGQDGSGNGIYARLYSSSGAPISPEFKVNTTTAGDQSFPQVAMDPAGGFVVTWSSNAQDGDSWGVYAQRFTSRGTPLGSEFRVNTTTRDTQFQSAIAMDNDGDFVVSWESAGQDGGQFGIFAQRYNSSGVAQGEEFRLNTTTFETQRFSSVAMDADGDFVVAWQSAAQDGSGYGIYAQRYQLESKVKVASGVLSARGTNLADTIGVDLVTPAGTATLLRVVLNGVNYQFDPATVNALTMKGLGGNDALSLGGSIVTPATLDGGAGNDILIGGAGDDVLLGGAGNDTYRYNAGSGLGSDAISDSSGIDTLDFSLTLFNGVSVNLGVAAQQTVNAHLKLTLSSGVEIENLIGGFSSDTLTGNSLANHLTGNVGSDTLIGAAGNDTYVFDVDIVQGTDTIIESGGGIDTLNFSESTLRGINVDLAKTAVQVVTPTYLSLILSENNTIENVIGSSGSDVIGGNSLSNRFVGGSGNDFYNFDADTPLGTDTIEDSSGVDSVSFTATTTKDVVIDVSSTVTQNVVSGNLMLTLSANNSIENIYGGSRNDRLTGNRLNNKILGGPGNDTMLGSDGDDTYLFDNDVATGTDSIQESTGIDTLDFSATTTQAILLDLSNTLTGQQVNPNLLLFLFTEFSIENVIGGSLGDTLTGNLLNNTFVGGPGNDVMTGGAGNDTYKFAANSSIGGDTIDEIGGGVDTLDFSDTTVQAVSIDLARSNVQTVNTALSLTLSAPDTIENVIGGTQADVLTGNALANILTGGGGDDTMNGAEGNDTYLFDTDLVLGADTIFEFSGGVDTLDFSATTTRDVSVNLNLRSSQVVTSGKLTVALPSGNTIENVIGGALNDWLVGNALNNRLTGGGGDDFLQGTAGNDTYLFDADLNLGRDTIYDYEGSSDTLYFGATTTRSVSVDLSVLSRFQKINDGLSIYLQTFDGIENVVGGFLGDTINGDEGGNTLTGGGGNDVLSGAAGDDVYVFDTDTSLGTDTIIDVSGVDTIDLSTTTTRAVELDLSLATSQVVNAGLSLILMSGNAVENANGGTLNDIIIGNSRGNVLTGNNGDDVLVGRAGNDILVGDQDRNILIGGDGADQLTSGAYEDLLVGARYLYEHDSVALEMLRSEWVSASSFTDRSGHLLGTLAGGLNDGFTLTRSTVKEDSSSDRLIGGAGRDWYLRNSLGTPTVFRDLVTDGDLDSLFTEIEAWL